MLKKYAFGAGLALSILGLVNFFVPGFETSSLPAILHIAAGVLGMALTIRGREKEFIKWLAVVALLLAALAFAGVTAIWQIVEFPIGVKWFYLILGLLAVWVYISVKQAEARN